MRICLCALPLIGVVIEQALWRFPPIGCAPRKCSGCGAVPDSRSAHSASGWLRRHRRDVLASCAPPEEKAGDRDSRCGAFAVIRLGCLVGGQLCVPCHGPALACFGMSFVLSRALSSWAVATFPLRRDCPYLRHLGGPDGGAPGAAGPRPDCGVGLLWPAHLY